MTSPMPARPGERERVRAGRDPDPRHLGQAAGHEPGLAVVAEAQLLGGAGRDRDDVLERPAQLDAEHVAVDVEPELAAARGGPGSARPAPRPPRRRPPRRAARERSRARGWARTGRRSVVGSKPPASAITSLIRRCVPRSMPLTTDSRSARAATSGATAATVSRRCADGTAKTTRSVAAASAAGSAVARMPVGQVDPRQAPLVAGASPRSGPPSPGSGTGASPAPAGRRSPRASCPRRRRRRRRRAADRLHAARSDRGRLPCPAHQRAPGARRAALRGPLLADLLAEHEPDRRPVEAVRLAQPVLEVPPVGEVDRRGVAWRRTRTSAAPRRPGWRTGSSRACRGRRPAASARRPRRPAG